MKFKIEAKCVLTLEHKEGEKTSKHVTPDFNLEVSENIERDMFLNENDLPTEAGSKAITQCFVQGLIGNIHFAHENGFRNDAEHLRYIISELEQGFIRIPKIYESNFDK